jgi:hypothetical protein
MKLDIDSIFYIVLSILILALTGLTRRKKKSTLPGTGLQNLQERQRTLSQDERSITTGDVINDPFESLQKLFAQTESIPSREAVSLEELIDEETEYLKEQEAARKKEPKEQAILKEVLTKQPAEDQEEKGIKKAGKLALFENADELKRAVIYSEILNRKEY